MKDRKTYEKISASIKAGDKRATREAINEMNARTTRKREQFRTGRFSR